MKGKLLFILLSLTCQLTFGQEDDDMLHKNVEPEDSILLERTFKEFLVSIEKIDTQKIKKLSLDSVECQRCFSNVNQWKFGEDYMVSIEVFIDQVFKDFKKSPIRKAIYERGYRFSYYYVRNFKPKNIPENYPKDLCLYEVWTQTFLPNDWFPGYEGQSDAFQFIKINGQFKFYGMTSIP